MLPIVSSIVKRHTFLSAFDVAFAAHVFAAGEGNRQEDTNMESFVLYTYIRSILFLLKKITLFIDNKRVFIIRLHLEAETLFYLKLQRVAPFQLNRPNQHFCFGYCTVCVA